jgi:hypothetical protein
VISPWPHIEKAISNIPALLSKFQRYKWKISAIIVFVAIASSVFVFAYLSYREPILNVEDEQITGFPSQGPMHPELVESIKSYSVDLVSIDEGAGTVHVRAKVHWPPGIGRLKFLNFIPERYKTDETRKNPYPLQVLYGPLRIVDVGTMDFDPMNYPDLPTHNPPTDFSESAPVSTEADIQFIDGNPWFYPFDRYYLSAQIQSIVLVTRDRQTYFNIVRSDWYTLSSKLPNLVVRNVNAKDIEYWTKLVTPEADPRKAAQSYRPGVWRQGRILLVLERPLFRRFFAVFFLILALAWIAIVAMVSDLKQLSVNVFGYFLAIWAIRTPLAAGGPNVSTLMDYVTLGLYALLIAVALAKFIWEFRKI